MIHFLQLPQSHFITWTEWQYRKDRSKTELADVNALEVGISSTGVLDPMSAKVAAENSDGRWWRQGVGMIWERMVELLQTKVAEAKQTQAESRRKEGTREKTYISI